LNYPGDPTNPILNNQPSGLGHVYSSAEIYQVIPTASLALTDRFSIGFAPIVTLSKVSVDPLFVRSDRHLRALRRRNRHEVFVGSGLPSGHVLHHGIQLALRREHQEPAMDGVVQVPFAADPRRTDRRAIGLRHATTVSLGAAYSGFERWMFAFDVRYLDWANAKGFREQGYLPNNAVAGLGWRSTMAVSLGTQYELTPRLTLRSVGNTCRIRFRTARRCTTSRAR